MITLSKLKELKRRYDLNKKVIDTIVDTAQRVQNERYDSFMTVKEGIGRGNIGYTSMNVQDYIRSNRLDAESYGTAQISVSVKGKANSRKTRDKAKKELIKMAFYEVEKKDGELQAITNVAYDVSSGRFIGKDTITISAEVVYRKVSKPQDDTGKR